MMGGLLAADVTRTVPRAFPLPIARATRSSLPRDIARQPRLPQQIVPPRVGAEVAEERVEVQVDLLPLPETALQPLERAVPVAPVRVDVGDPPRLPEGEPRDDVAERAPRLVVVPEVVLRQRGHVQAIELGEIGELLERLGGMPIQHLVLGELAADPLARRHELERSPDAVERDPGLAHRCLDDPEPAPVEVTERVELDGPPRGRDRILEAPLPREEDGEPPVRDRVPGAEAHRALEVVPGPAPVALEMAQQSACSVS